MLWLVEYQLYKSSHFLIAWTPGVFVLLQWIQYQLMIWLSHNCRQTKTILNLSPVNHRSIFRVSNCVLRIGSGSYLPGIRFGPWSPSLVKITLVPAFHPLATSIVNIFSRGSVVIPSSCKTFQDINNHEYTALNTHGCNENRKQKCNEPCEIF